jgi:hypothetical protein
MEKTILEASKRRSVTHLPSPSSSPPMLRKEPAAEAEDQDVFLDSVGVRIDAAHEIRMFAHAAFDCRSGKGDQRASSTKCAVC